MKHTYYKCEQPCFRIGCQFCEGGLGHCTVCNGFEGTLPTDCPGRKMSEEIENAVWKGGLDFKEDSGWYQQDANQSYKFSQPPKCVCGRLMKNHRDTVCDPEE